MFSVQDQDHYHDLLLLLESARASHTCHARDIVYRTRYALLTFSCVRLYVDLEPRYVLFQSPSSNVLWQASKFRCSVLRFDFVVRTTSQYISVGRIFHNVDMFLTVCLPAYLHVSALNGMSVVITYLIACRSLSHIALRQSY